MREFAIDLEIMAEGLAFPEGPIALADGSVILVEIQRGTLTRVAADGTCSVIANLGGGPNGAALGPDGLVYVCNNGGFTWHEVEGALIPSGTPDEYVTGSIQRVDPASSDFAVLYDTVNGRRLRGPNDLVFDASGGFWFTDHGKPRADSAEHGAICYARADGSHIELAIDHLRGPNGIGISPDGTMLYWAETPTSRLWSRRIIAPGRLAPADNPLMPGELIFAMPDYRLFDSLKVEAGGAVCVGSLVQGGIAVIHPGGECEFVRFPELAVTNLAFGGPDLRTVWATASSSGRLYRMRWPRAGLALSYQEGIAP